MQRVLLVSANREHFPAPVFPLGLAYMAGALKKHGVTVRIFDAGLHGSPLKELVNVLKTFRPDSIGLSLRNIDNAAYPHTQFYVPDYVSLAEAIRKYSRPRVILGGPAFSIFSGELMNLLEAEAGVTGEGEAETERFWESGGVGIFKGRAVSAEGIHFPEDIDSVFPRFRDYRTIGIQTARGCPGRCSYCTYPLIEGARLRTRPPEAVAGEIAFLNRKFSRKDFFIVDSLFNSDEEHMCRVLEAIIALDLKVSFSCYMKPKVDNPAVFRLLKRAGCIAVDFGTDSGSGEMLRSLNKGFFVEDVVDASHACRTAGLDFCHSLLFGAPGETPETIRETVSLMDRLRPRAVIAMTGIRMYPGSGLTLHARKEGYLAPGLSLLEPSFYFSEMGPSRLVALVHETVSGKRNWFFPGKRNWSKAIGPRLLRLIHRRGPLWLRFKPGDA